MNTVSKALKRQTIFDFELWYYILDHAYDSLDNDMSFALSNLELSNEQIYIIGVTILIQYFIRWFIHTSG